MEPFPHLSPPTGHQSNSLVRKWQQLMSETHEEGERRERRMWNLGNIDFKSSVMIFISFGSINRNDTLCSGGKGTECHLISFFPCTPYV